MNHIHCQPTFLCSQESYSLPDYLYMFWWIIFTASQHFYVLRNHIHCRTTSICSDESYSLPANIFMFSGIIFTAGLPLYVLMNHIHCQATFTCSDESYLLPGRSYVFMWPPFERLKTRISISSMICTDFYIIIIPPQNEVVAGGGGILVSLCLSFCLSIRPASRLLSVAPTVLVRSISLFIHLIKQRQKVCCQ